MSRFFAICFDISDPKRLRAVSNTLENYGTRVQRSLFECHLDTENICNLKNTIEGLIDKKEDHVRYYPMCPKDIEKIRIEGHGKITLDKDYFMI